MVVALRFVVRLETTTYGAVMEKTYQILLTLKCEQGADKKTIRECIYSYLEELIADDTLYFSEVDKNV